MTRTFITGALLAGAAMTISAAAPTTYRGVSPMHRIAAAPASDETYYESFEYDNNPYGWREATADLGWLPDGWTRQGADEAKGVDRWFAYPFEYMTRIPCHDGNYVMTILYSDEPKDEWLISPELEIGAGRHLTFAWYYQPLYFWMVDRYHVDFDNQRFTVRELAATMQVLISADGGEWTLLRDLSTDYADLDYDVLSTLAPEQMMQADIPLDDYAGQRVRVAFRYTGTDGDSMFIDAVSINNGVDRTPVDYSTPLSTLYLGCTPGGDIYERAAMLQPWGCELTWTNTSAPDAACSWLTAGLPVVSETAEELTLQFPAPEAGQPCSAPYPAVAISGQAEGSAPAEYTDAVEILSGGYPEIDGVRYGLLPFDIHSCDTYTHTEEPVDFGHRGIPIFGYSEDTDAWWRMYMCGGDEKNLDHIPYARLTSIFNGVVAAPRALTVEGAVCYAVGLVDGTARFSCTVWALDQNGTPSRPLATSEISGADMQVIDKRMNLNYYAMPFEFANPAVLDREGTCEDLYVIEITGMHDGGVEYFAPVMQYLPDRYERCLGYYRLEYEFAGTADTSFGYVASHRGEQGEMYCAFAINLIGGYAPADSGIAGIETQQGRQAVYDITGRPSQCRVPGVYVVRDTDGTVKKVRASQ